VIEDLVKSENEITEARPTKSSSSTGRTKMTPPTKNLSDVVILSSEDEDNANERWQEAGIIRALAWA
jgi:hypothetical protein